MREKLNSNPLVQVAVIGVLLVGAGFFLLTTMGGGEEEEAASTEATVTVAGTDVSGSASGATPGEAVDAAVAELGSSSAAAAAAAPPPPRRVTRAYESNQTVVLLFVRPSGIDDRRVKVATAAARRLPRVALFVVPARQIARYAAITQGVGVDRVPALVVVTPKRVKQSLSTASVSYGFQSPQSVVQAVIDAGYEGPTVNYHP